jgi:Zn-dependent protease
MRFSTKEKRDLTVAGLMISVAFAILVSGGITGIKDLSNRFLILFISAFFTAGIGFISHEFMHKYAASRHGFHSEFKASYPMLWFAIIASFFGFIFAAPGAVFIQGKLSKSQNGKISLAGPLTNLVLAIIFLLPLLIAFLFSVNINPNVNFILNYGMSINALLAFFNLLPFSPFDGSKVYSWNKTIYFSSLIISILLFVGSWGFNAGF